MPDIDLFTKPLVYAVPGMDEVETRRNVVYRTLDDGTELTMDVYSPPGLTASERRPGVVLVHGGPVPVEAWPTVKDWAVFTSYGRLLAASGLIGVTFNHRYVRMQQIEESASYIDSAFAYARGQASAFHLDPERLAAWAFSGGGPFLGPLLTARPAWLRCLLSYYAVLDLRPVKDRIPGGLSDEALQRFSPVACLPAGGYDGPPVLIARAGRDQPWLNATVDDFVHRALAANVPLDLMNHPQGQHGFDILDDDARSREILARTLDFLKARR
jgi:acetyl esterase/lipase